ncbi:gamma-glutamylcyclotransferase [Frigidibacter sp. MR17.14]|uniref:gamma-glutamylcyclotransferase n=1 Tax=Frigidibacter sp. MR17.14 TaxID=3126509 RepID=UPI0030130B84
MPRGRFPDALSLLAQTTSPRRRTIVEHAAPKAGTVHLEQTELVYELTEDLVRLVERTEPDPGPEPGSVEHSQADFEAIADALLSKGAPDTLTVFAYGSLIWNPEFEHEKVVRAVATGWHRSFCLKLIRWRGTRELPALMLALDRGGACEGP